MFYRFYFTEQENSQKEYGQNWKKYICLAIYDLFQYGYQVQSSLQIFCRKIRTQRDQAFSPIDNFGCECIAGVF